MPCKRKLVAATFINGVLALSLQPGDFAHAHSVSTIMLVADQSSGGSQNGGRSGQQDAGKMQSNKGALSSGGKVDPMDPPSTPSSGSNLRMQQNSGGTPTNPESNRTFRGSNDPLSDGNTVDPSKTVNPTTR